jgi:hypothetical protein
MVRHGHALAWFFAVTAVAGCGSTPRPREPTPGEKLPAGTKTTRSSEGTIAPQADVVRGCDRYRTGVGYGGVTKEGFRRSLRVGAIALGNLRVLRRSQLEPARVSQRRFLPIESVAKVDAGAVVTVAVAAADRRHVGLIYDQSKFRPDGRYRIEDLDDVVRFEACTDPAFNHGYSQFDGGFVVAGQRCFALDIYIDGHHYRRPGLADC